MKTWYLLFLASLLSLPNYTQIFQEDFEAYPIGTGGSTIGYNDFSNGSSEVAAGANGNTTQVLLASNAIGGDHFLRSELFPVEENAAYRVTLDISVTNTVYFIRIRTEDDAGNNTIMPTTDVLLTTDNGALSPTNPARIESVTANTFGTSTATFTVPAGATKAQFQIYQFGVNSFMLDNITVEEVEIAAPPNWSSEAEAGILSGAYSGNGLKVKNLKSYAICDHEVMSTRQWLVVNPNSFAVEFSWVHDEDPGQFGTIIAAPGNTYFFTNVVAGINKENITITWMDEAGNVITKKLKSTDCYEEEVATLTTAGSQTARLSDIETGLKVLYPNPISRQGTLNLLLSTPAEGLANLQLLDLKGRQLHANAKNVVSGDNLIQIDLSAVNLATQLFFVQVELDGVVFSRKVLIVD